MKTIIIFAALMISCYAVEDQTSYEETVLRPPGTPQHIHASLPSASTNLAKRPTFEYITNSFGKFDTPSFGYITNSYGNTNYGSYIYPYVQPGGYQVVYKQIKNTGPTYPVQERYPIQTYPTRQTYYPRYHYEYRYFPSYIYPSYGYAFPYKK